MKRLRIGIDGYNLALHDGTGVATYGSILARTLNEAGHSVAGVFGIDVGCNPHRRQARFIAGLATPSAQRRGWAKLRYLLRADVPALPITAYDVPITRGPVGRGGIPRLSDFTRLVSAPDLFALAHRRFNRTGRFTHLHMIDPPEIMHWTYPLPIRLVGALNIYTLHDLVPLRLPHTTMDGKAQYYALVQACVRQAAHVCTVSDASRRDIVGLLGAAKAHVTNCYQASPLEKTPEDATNPVAGLPARGYFLFFGAIEPKKNVGRLLEAYLATGIQTPLVLVGREAWQSEEEMRLMDQARGRVIHLDYLPRKDLLRLIGSAKAVLFPSLYEGFGLPVLEAMQLGVPVLTSNTSALPEVGGNAAIYSDPYSVASIAEGLRRLEDDTLLRARLAQAGPERADLFSQSRYLTRLETMYGNVLAQ